MVRCIAVLATRDLYVLIILFERIQFMHKCGRLILSAERVVNVGVSVSVSVFFSVFNAPAAIIIIPATD